MALLDKFPRFKAFLVGKEQRPLYGQGFEERSFNAFHSGYQPIFSISYDGEKNQGAMGPIQTYWLDYIALRARSWASYLDSEITQGIINKFKIWTIGTGLKLQSEPSKLVLESEGIAIDKEEFSKFIEARFMIFGRSKKVDHSERKNLHQLAGTAYINSDIGGDVLVVLRLVKENITIQLIDGSQVQQPLFTSKFHADAKGRGNTIRHGVERDKAGKHIAYYIRKAFNDFTIIKAKSAGRLTAFLVYGSEYRIDNVRGIPRIVAVMESIKKIDRYKEATVGSAEERQKIAFAIEHDVTSTGENPLLAGVKAAFNADVPKQTGKIDGEAVANKIAATTDKQVINMPIGAKLHSLEAKNELYYDSFITSNRNSIASSINIPPEVAYSKYDSNFSASRAALKDWEHTLIVNRGDFSFQFYQNIYNFWFEVQVLLNKIQAPGYLEALARGNDMVIESYRNARFVGANVPHIDPVKEVTAERLKLGNKFVPLTTVEAATEAVNGGDYDQNVEQVIKEVEKADVLNMDKIEEPIPPEEEENEEK